MATDVSVSRPASTARVIQLPRLTDGRGDLTFFQVGAHVPFPIAEVSWLRPAADASGPLPIGGGDNFLVALSGSFRLTVGGAQESHTLEGPDRALLVPEGRTVALESCAANGCLLVCSAAALAPMSATPVAFPAPLERCAIPAEPALGGSMVRGSAIVPFPVRRIYYLYNVPPSQERGAHAHRELRQLIVAARGSFEVELDDLRDRRRILLDDPRVGLPVTRMVWRDLHAFTPDAVCLVLASELYDEGDYIRDHDEYRRLASEQA